VKAASRVTRGQSTSQSTRDHAAIALRFAVLALADAESSACDADELAGLCDEVIRRRLRLQTSEIDAGSRPSRAVKAQMERDHCLLAEHAEYHDRPLS
jgi:hypothetical protein